MKSYLALTWKELKTQKITATLILIAVIMSTIITTVVGQSIGILQSMRNRAGCEPKRKPICNISSTQQGTSTETPRG